MKTYSRDGSLDGSAGSATSGGMMPAGVDGLNGVARRGRGKSSWLFSLTAVCFLFGGLLATQLRAIQHMETKKANNQKAQVEISRQAASSKIQAVKSERETAAMQAKMDVLKRELASSKGLSAKQAKQLNARIKEMEMIAGLTPVSGAGIRVVLSDNVEIASAASGSNPFLPGMVHDFDLLQIVNELRAANAEAMAIRNTRITGYTPIRCVGPAIQINWDGAASPFVIEAIGDPNTLENALNMPGGILSILRDPERGPVLGVKISRVNKLSLPAATGSAPRFKVAQTG